MDKRVLDKNTILAGKYLVVSVLGEGGFGVTYKCKDLNIENYVAIKEYFPTEYSTRQGDAVTALSGELEKLYQKGLKKFVNEAEMLAKFQNLPGIVSVKEFFYENETAYMVMEYIDGITLKSYLKSKGGNISYFEAIQLMKPVIESLKIVHKSGVVHRDISPDNIMLTLDGKVKLIDFGAARFVDTENEKSLTVILKHGYAPVEQYQKDGKQGPWTDVYAICATIYHIISGYVPQDAPDRLINGDHLQTLHQFHSSIPSQVSDSVQKGLAVQAEKRTPNMDDLYHGLYERKENRKMLICISGIFIIFVILIFAFYKKNMSDTENELYVENETNLVSSETETNETVQKELVVESEEKIELSQEEQDKIVYKNHFPNMQNDFYFDLDGDGREELIILEIEDSVYQESITGKIYTIMNNEVELLENISEAYDYTYTHRSIANPKDSFGNLDLYSSYFRKYYISYSSTDTMNSCYCIKTAYYLVDNPSEVLVDDYIFEMDLYSKQQPEIHIEEMIQLHKVEEYLENLQKEFPDQTIFIFDYKFDDWDQDGKYETALSIHKESIDYTDSEYGCMNSEANIVLYKENKFLQIKEFRELFYDEDYYQLKSLQFGIDKYLSIIHVSSGDDGTTYTTIDMVKIEGESIQHDENIEALDVEIKSDEYGCYFISNNNEGKVEYKDGIIEPYDYSENHRYIYFLDGKYTEYAGTEISFEELNQFENYSIELEKAQQDMENIDYVSSYGRFEFTNHGATPKKVWFYSNDIIYIDYYINATASAGNELQGIVGLWANAIFKINENKLSYIGYTKGTRDAHSQKELDTYYQEFDFSKYASF